MLHGYLDIDVVLRPVEIQNFGVQRCFASVQVRNVLPDSSLIVEDILSRFSVFLLSFFPKVGKRDLEPLGQKGHLTESCLNDVIIIYRRFLEYRRIRLEGDTGSCILCRAGSNHVKLVLHMTAVFKTNDVYFTVLSDGNLKPAGKSIDNRCSNSMKTTGNLVSPAAEFAARVKNGIDHLHCSHAGFVIDSDRNSASIVRYRNTVPRIDENLNMRAVSGKGLINGIIYDLIDQMMKSSGGRGSNVHAGTLANCLKSLKNLNVIGRIGSYILRILDIVVLIFLFILGIFPCKSLCLLRLLIFLRGL